jgi:hypothetical protein
MTIAFFVMGSDLGNWCCVFGGKRPLSRRKEREDQRQAEEYKKWKTEHKKTGEMLFKGSKGMGALVSAAGKVAKWSLVEDPSKGDQSPRSSGWRSPLSGKGKVLEEEKDWDAVEMGTNRGVGMAQLAEDDMIAKDKKLREIDFRYGREAARAEMAKKTSSGRGTPISSPLSVRTPAPVPLTDSTASLPAIPPAAVYPPRRGSVPGYTTSGHMPGFSSSSTEVFTPGYNFPPRIDSSTANLLRNDTAQNSPMESDASPSWPRRGSLEIPPHIPFDYSTRRASLPTAKPIPDNTFSSTLSRIQSLPEADQDHHSTPPLSVYSRVSPSFSGSQGKAPTPMLEQGLGSLPDQGKVPEPENEEEKRKAERERYWEKKDWSVKIQRFLGFDVVTKEEVFKIVLTGTIAGFGVAGMRTFCFDFPERQQS